MHRRLAYLAAGAAIGTTMVIRIRTLMLLQDLNEKLGRAERQSYVDPHDPGSFRAPATRRERAERTFDPRPHEVIPTGVQVGGPATSGPLTGFEPRHFGEGPR